MPRLLTGSLRSPPCTSRTVCRFPHLRPLFSASSPSQPRRSYASAVPLPLSHPPPSSYASGPTKSYGQPLPSTHPHLLAHGELTPGIQAKEYEQRRRKLMENLEDGATVVIAGGNIVYMSQNIFYRFRQRSNFWYLTGFEEPDSALILQKDSSSEGYRMTMFVQPKDSYDELWNGARSGIEGAVEIFGADDAVNSNYFASRLRSILSTSSGPVYIDLPSHTPTSVARGSSRRSPSRSFLSYLTSSPTSKSEADEVLDMLSKRDVRSTEKEVERLRLIKSDAEVAVMKRAADISCAAHSKREEFALLSLTPTRSQVMRLAKPGITESALVSHFEHHCSLAGSPRPAYVPVCASGKQALTIHYVENNRPCKEGEMVLLDAGCEYGGYASDVTRTFPVSSSFTSAQRDLYEAVLRVLKHTSSYCTASNSLSLEDLHRISVEATRTELRDLGFHGMRAGDLERVLYPHFVSHPLGVDLHDTRSFGREEKIKAGMVITIEPGLYVPPHPNFPKAFHNQVVRLEDEVHVQEEDHIVLSVEAPKEVADVEAVCRGWREEAGEA
ncbi:hypothetical protein JCM11641_004408 [Rhodosporidiobolus odoratus]